MRSLGELFLRVVDGVFAVDAGQRIVFWDAGCARLFGLSSKQAVGRPCIEVVQGRDPGNQPFCRSGCCVSRLMRGETGLGAFPLRVSGNAGRELRLTVNLLLVPSLYKEGWRCLHLVRQGSPAELLDLLGAASGKKSRHARAGPGDPVSILSLTLREQEILQLLAEGLSVPAISELLHLSATTVRNHLQHIEAKLGVHSQAEAVAYAYRNHLVTAAPRREVTPHFAAQGGS